MTDRKPPKRHPSTLIPEETVRDGIYRLYLQRLGMTAEQSRATATVVTVRGKTLTQDDAYRRKCADCLEPLFRDALRVLVDMGLVVVGDSEP